MTRLVAGVLRPGRGARLAIFLVAAVTATITAVAGQIMATALGAPGAGRFAAANAVVRSDPSIEIGTGEERESIDVRRSAPLSQADLARVTAIPDVGRAVGDVTFPVAIAQRDGALLEGRDGSSVYAHGWSSAALTPYRLIAGVPPLGPHDIVLDADLAHEGGLRPGDLVRLVTPTGASVSRLSGIAKAIAGEEAREAAAFVPDSRAQELSGMERGFEAIAVFPAARAEPSPLMRRVATAIGGGAQVLDHRHAAAADPGDPDGFERTRLVAVVASAGGINLAVAAFVLAGIVAFAITGRRRELVLLRTVGATRGRVRRTLLAGTVGIALLSGVVGCLAAAELGRFFCGGLAAVSIVPRDFTIAPSILPYAIAVASTGFTAAVATLLAARPFLAGRPSGALVETSATRRGIGAPRWVLGICALAGGLALTATLSSEALSFATLAAFCLTIGVTILAPVLLGAPAGLLGRQVRRTGPGGFLAGS